MNIKTCESVQIWTYKDIWDPGSIIPFVGSRSGWDRGLLSRCSVIPLESLRGKTPGKPPCASSGESLGRLEESWSSNEWMVKKAPRTMQADLMSKTYAWWSRILHLLKAEVQILIADIFESCPNLSPLLQGGRWGAADHDLGVSNHKYGILGFETWSQTKGTDPRESCSISPQMNVLWPNN